MEEMLKRIFSRYGGGIEYRDGAVWRPVEGFLQPVTGSRPERTVCPAGELPGQLYLFFGMPEPPLTEGMLLRKNGRQFRLRRVTVYELASGPCYCRGTCTEREGTPE